MSKWFPFLDENNLAPYRLICFHHAGGSALTFSSWLNHFSDIELIPAELPGHGTRIGESCGRNFQSVIEELAEAVFRIRDDRPFYFLGHSMGSLIAFQTA